MKNPQDKFYARLIDAVSDEVQHDGVSASRHAIMALVAEGYGADCTSVLLWLRDEEKGRPVLRLSSIHDQKTPPSRPVGLLNISIPWDEISFPPIPDEINERIRIWYKEIHNCHFQAGMALKLDTPEKTNKRTPTLFCRLG